MKQQTQEFLIDFISHNLYGKCTGYDFELLFKLYSALEIKTFSEILPRAKEFCSFLENHSHLITTADPAHAPRIPDKIASLRHTFKTYFETRGKIDQKIFADIVTTIAPNKRKTKTLDVGASKFPYSSILMAKKIEQLESMDKNFLLSNESLFAMNVIASETLFDEQTSVNDYDFIVGRYPCSAIIPIVKACKASNKPYFIELCECSIPWPSKWPAGEYFGWENVLPEIDPNVHVMNGYAFNIDATESQIMRVINRQNMKKIFTFKNDIYVPRRISNNSNDTVVISDGTWSKQPEEFEMI
ncbi:MAG: hypothetical protein IJW24_02295 [Clostridia bacterium]|nr:hypothetical protein [Clostridia bacterium]